MRLLTDEWCNLTRARRDALLAAGVTCPASVTELAVFLYGEDYTGSQYASMSHSLKYLRENDYVKLRTPGEDDHGNAKIYDITADGRLLLDRNVIEPARELKR